MNCCSLEDAERSEPVDAGDVDLGLVELEGRTGIRRVALRRAAAISLCSL